jgi:hypothetical protein
MELKPKIYFHDRQLELMRIHANSEYIIAPRGWGKSEGIDAPRLLRNIWAMPKSNGVILSPTYGKLLRNTLPAVFRSLERYGYRRNRHYFVGRQAPKFLNFQKPVQEPFDWEYTIHWFNGSINSLISFDRPMSANSMSVDYVMGFESKFLDYEKITSEVIPANRGNEDLYTGCPWHHGYTFTTDMPTRKSGMWIFDKENEMDKELINVIIDTYGEIKRLEKRDIHPQRLNKLRNDLNFFRSKAVLYYECDPFDNIDLLTERFFKDMKRNLSPFEYRTAILNQRIKKLEHGFYSSMSEKAHCYDGDDVNFLKALDYDLDKAAELDCRKDADMDHDKPLYIALDYNANINWLVCGQPDYEAKTMRTLKSFFVKGDNRLMQLLRNFDDYYKTRHNKDVIYYHTNTALQGAYALSADTFADSVLSTLSQLGWSVMPVYMGQAPNHVLKHRYINDGFKGLNYLLPLINRSNNDELITAMEQTGVRVGPEGFKKDKSGEKLPETPEDQLEYRTDGTDAWDDLYMGCVLHPYEFAISGSPSIISNSR